MSKQTIASTNARIDALESKIDEGFALLLARLEPTAPAKTVTRKPARKAPAKRTVKAAAPKAAPVKVRALCKSTRVAFVAAASEQGLADFSGMSTKVIVSMCLEDEALIPAGFVIGDRYRALLG